MEKSFEANNSCSSNWTYFWILAHYAKARAYITQAQKDTVDWENSDGGVAVVVVVIELQPQSPIDFLD